MAYRKPRSKDERPVEIEPSTASFWVKQGAIKIESHGNENTYYINEFGMQFYCKNYPQFNADGSVRYQH